MQLISGGEIYRASPKVKFYKLFYYVQINIQIYIHINVQIYVFSMSIHVLGFVV